MSYCFGFGPFFLMAQQKMQFALRKSSTNNGKVADGGICTPKKSFSQNNRKLDREDSEVSSSNLRNSDQRCVIFTLVKDELVACWRVLGPFIIPLRGTDHRNHLKCGSHVKMDSLEPVSPSPAALDMQKSQTNDHLQDHTGHNDFIGTGSADLVNGSSKVDKPMKKSSRKKSKKKRRKQKKAFRNCETAIASDQGIHGVYALDSCSNSVSALGDVCSLDNDLSENATPFSVSSQEIMTGNFYDAENSNDTINLSATSSKATSCSDDVELLERAASLPHDSASDDFGSNQLGVNDVTTNTMQTREATLSDFNAVLLDAHLKLNATLPVTSSGSSSEEQSAPVLDSFYDGWNSDGCKPLIRKENRVHPFDSGSKYDSNNGIANNDTNWSKAVGRTDSDGTRCGQGDASSSSSDGFTVISRKKGKQKRNSLMSSNEKHRVSNDVDGHRRSGKGSNYSLCQRAQKIDEDKCFCVPKNIDPIGSRVDASNVDSFFAKPNTFVDLTKKMHEKSIRSACLHEITAQGDMRRRSARTDVNASSLKSEYGSWKNKLLERLKREPGSESKQESIHNSRNDCHTSEATLVRPTKMNVPQKEVGIPLAGNSCSRFGSYSTSSSCFRSGSINSSSLEPLKYSEDCPEKTRLLRNVIPVGSDGIAQALHKQTGTLSAVSDSPVQLAVESDSSSNFSMDKPGDSCIHVCNENEPAEPETCVLKVENGKSDHDSGSISQNWIPVGRKDDETFYHFPASQLDDAFSYGWNLNSTGEEQLSSVPFTNAGVTGFGSSSGRINFTLSKDEVPTELGYHTPGIPKELSSVHIPSSYQPIQKSYEQDISVDETDPSCISQAVNDAHRVQIESEGIQLATGFPLAEFEKLLFSAAPVLDQTCSIQHCNTCFGDHLVGDFLCRHQIPNVTLGSLWQWYEMIGSYGLEVKVEDCYDLNSKRFGGDPFQFDAYFVPFLSAVQLFGHASSSIDASNVTPNTSFTNKNNVDATLEYSSHFGSHHVFSVPLRPSHKEEESDLSLPMNLLNISDSSSPSGQYGVCKQSLSSTCLSDPELLFEYFESEPPRQRRPLFDKIQELVRGNAPSKSQIFGESWKLMGLHLHDLHPSSWYSVAWYPIYRIPAGKFGAAFLTYHSLGHFGHRSASSDFISGGASIVSPVVGLQSYNAQGECWFRPKNSMMFQMEGSPYSNPSKVLKERVRTLEQTADVMAKASFLKGNRKFVNRQPDYEFFLSRRR